MKNTTIARILHLYEALARQPLVELPFVTTEVFHGNFGNYNDVVIRMSTNYYYLHDWKTFKWCKYPKSLVE